MGQAWVAGGGEVAAPGLDAYHCVISFTENHMYVTSSVFTSAHGWQPVDIVDCAGDVRDLTVQQCANLKKKNDIPFIGNLLCGHRVI